MGQEPAAELPGPAAARAREEGPGSVPEDSALCSGHSRNSLTWDRDTVTLPLPWDIRLQSLWPLDPKTCTSGLQPQHQMGPQPGRLLSHQPQKGLQRLLDLQPQKGPHHHPARV